MAKRIGLSDLRFFHYRKINKTGYRNFIDIETLSNMDNSKVATEDLWNRYYRQRRFNVLGTGWVKWTYDQEPIGFEGIKIKSKIREDFKTEIAWCRDMRTGYCFNQNTLSADFFDKLERGADIKVPWELARMYHWPQLALLALWNRVERKSIIEEFIFEIEDFEKIPVGKSIQYACAMEVAIRAVNLLIAFDIFTQIDKEGYIDANFKESFISFMWKHQEVILNCLEVDLKNGKNGNHYLADLCGLLFLSSYLQGKEADRCFTFAQREFFKEIDKQFLEDGTNIECSTAYHRLSSEIVIFGLMMIQRGGKKIPETLYKKLLGMYKFLHMIKKPNGRIVQIGDNDSGHIVRLNPVGQYINESSLFQYNINWKNFDDGGKQFFFQEELSVEPCIAMFEAFFGLKNTTDKISYKFYKSIIDRETLEIVSDDIEFNIESREVRDITPSTLFFRKKSVIQFAKSYDFSSKKILVSKCFGLIIVKQDDFFMAVRTVPEYKKMRLGHVHNDVLHFELSIGENEYFIDPGSYVYTGHRKWRDQFRSDVAHNIPVYKEKWIEIIDMFSSKAEVSGECFIFENRITVAAVSKRVIHVRCFTLHCDNLVVEDFSNEDFELKEEKDFRNYSLGYGMRTEETNKCIRK
ncbi:MAG: hypothetical protein HFI33_11635 [Lachnospiraceae bacterium]|nr:hypothetical protein [Lachnospiraceae bacterium]